MHSVNDSQQEQVTNALYEAALQPELWPKALRRLAAWVGAEGVMVVTGEPPEARLLVAGGHDDEWLAAYTSQWLAEDPRFGGLERGTRRDMRLSQLRGWEQAFGIGCSFADRLAPNDRKQGVLWVVLSMEYESARGRAAVRYGRLRSHLQRALRLTRRAGASSEHAAALRDLADELPLGVLLVSVDGRIEHANALAAEILDREDSLQSHDGRLRALRHGDDQRLRDALRDAAADGGTQWLTVPRRDDSVPYSLAIRAGDERAGGRCLLRVVVGDGLRTPAVGAAALAALFDLTGREAQVCARLVRGMSIDEAATDLGVSSRTARVYLQQVFTKLGVHRQAELVRLLMSCPTLLESAQRRAAAQTAVSGDAAAASQAADGPSPRSSAARPPSAA